MHVSDRTDITVGHTAHNHTLSQAHSEQCKWKSAVPVVLVPLSGLFGQWKELFRTPGKKCIQEALLIITRYCELSVVH